MQAHTKEEFHSLKLLLNEVITSLTYMNDDNFDSSLKNAVRCMEESNELKNVIKVKYGTNVYKEIEPEINDIGRQIKTVFTNLLQEKQNELTLIGKELEFTRNKKNLSVYGR